MNEVHINLLKAGMTIVFLLLIDFIVEVILNKKIKNKRKSIKLRVLTRYVLFACLVFFMAKIWVEGFGYLLTVVSVISAALTITQKEYLQNFFGWLIIMWRDLFSEGDYIEINKYCGYVLNIGPLYFTLVEASETAWADKTGRLIKIPNSLVAQNPVVSFSYDKPFVENKTIFTFTFDSSLEKIQSLVPQLEEDLAKVYPKLYSQWSNRQRNAFDHLKKQNLHKPLFVLRVCQDNPSGIQLRVKYLSLRHEQKAIEDAIFNRIMESVSLQSDVALEKAS